MYKKRPFWLYLRTKGEIKSLPFVFSSFTFSPSRMVLRLDVSPSKRSNSIPYCTVLYITSERFCASFDKGRWNMCYETQMNISQRQQTGSRDTAVKLFAKVSLCRMRNYAEYAIIRSYFSYTHSQVKENYTKPLLIFHFHILYFSAFVKYCLLLLQSLI
jgi:hypothetical protein